jgi:TRAP transporter TAXI family solute receptor
MPPSRKDKPRQASGQWTSAAKALHLLRAFVDRQDQWGVRELANALDQPISSVHRLLRMLVSEGLVDWDTGTQKYSVGLELRRWAAVVGRRSKLQELARPILADLAASIDENCWFAVHDAPGQRIVYMLEAEGRRPLRFALPVGTSEPLTASAPGWAILAALDTASGGGAGADGVAVSEPGSDDAPVLVASAVLDGRDVPVGVIAAAVPRFRYGPQERATVSTAVGGAARRLSRQLGARILSGSSAATSHTGLAALAGLLRDRLPEVTVDPFEVRGQRKLSALQDGAAGYCAAVLDGLEGAYLGAAPFATPHDRLRIVLGLGPLHLHVLVRRDGPVRTLADLVTARVSPGEEDYATADLYRRLIAAIAKGRQRGATPTLRTIHLDYVEANREFEEGTIDALVSLNGVPTPAYVDIAGRVPLRMLSIDATAAAALAPARRSLTTATIAGASYPGIADDVATVATALVLVTTIDRSEDEVYELARTVDMFWADLATASPAFKGIERPSAPPTSLVPLHPGAARYWHDRSEDR